MNPKPSRISRLGFLDHHIKSPNTKPSCQAPRAQNPYNPELPLQRHLQRPQHWHRQDQDPEVARDTNGRVGDDDVALVDTGPACDLGAEPVCGDGLAEEDLDEECGDVVQEQDCDAGVDDDYFLAVWGEDSEHDC